MIRSLPRSLLFALFLTALVAPGMRAGDILDTLRALNRQYGGRLGVMAKNLDNGEIVSYQGTDSFPSASTIKLPILAAWFDKVGRKELDPDESIVLRREDLKGGSGILQFIAPGAVLTVGDAATLMTILSDNTGTNLLLDNLAPTHQERLETVNAFLRKKGLNNTRLLNRLFTAETKQPTPEAMRYGIGITTPEDMVILLEQLYRRTLTDSASCDRMIGLLKDQFYTDIIPRFMPDEAGLAVAHKTGANNEQRADVGIVFSKRVNFAIAIYVDKSQDHTWGMNNSGDLLGAHVARAIWNHFTGTTGEDPGPRDAGEVVWSSFPGGKWGVYRTTNAMFPHQARAPGFTRHDGTVYPFFPHYADSSVVVFVPEGFRETPEGSNVIVHFHGHMNDNEMALEQYRMPQAMIAARLNALLILPQGPYRARDSFGGKMEDAGGFQRLVDDVMAKMIAEKVIQTARVARIIVSAHSGGGRPAAFVLDRGGLGDKVREVFLFDALYEQEELFRGWLLRGTGTIRSAYTQHLSGAHTSFAASVGAAGARWSMTATDVHHEQVVQTFFPQWISSLPEEWRLP